MNAQVDLQWSGEMNLTQPKLIKLEIILKTARKMNA
jgi:hypothetical protein